MIFPPTASWTGRHVSGSPANSPLRRLSYGRIRLDGTTSHVRCDTGRHETALLCSDAEVDLVECSAEVDGVYPLQIVRSADVCQDPSMKFRADE
jgi:5-deoxy-glucuronate isomerase